MSRLKRQIVVLILSALLVVNLVCILIVETGEKKSRSNNRQLLHLKTNKNGRSEFSNEIVGPSAVDNLPEDFEAPGWERGVSTDTAHYLNPGKETARILPWKGGSGKKGDRSIYILVAVHSSPDHFSHRRSLRETFCSPCSGDGEFRKILSCECLFVLGLSDDEDVSLRVKEEAEEFGDVLVEDFADTYNNLTLKSLFMLKHFLEGPNRDAYSHIVKVDDDAFINVNRLQEMILEEEQSLGSEEGFLLGLITSRQAPARDTALLGSNKGKFLMPRYLYPGDEYPEYMVGYYAMSKEAADCIFKASFQEPLIYIEDIYVTGLAASHCPNAKRVQAGPSSFSVSRHPTWRFDVGETAVAHLGHLWENHSLRLWGGVKRMLEGKLKSERH